MVTLLFVQYFKNTPPEKASHAKANIKSYIENYRKHAYFIKANKPG
jgi:hypothetical protein